MDQNLIKNVMSPVNKFDAVSKNYADRIKYKKATGDIPNTVMTDNTIFTFPLCSGKIKYIRCGLNGWQMSGLQHQVQCSQLRGLAFTSFPEVRPL